MIYVFLAKFREFDQYAARERPRWPRPLDQACRYIMYIPVSNKPGNILNMYNEKKCADRSKEVQLQTLLGNYYRPTALLPQIV